MRSKGIREITDPELLNGEIILINDRKGLFLYHIRAFFRRLCPTKKVS